MISSPRGTNPWEDMYLRGGSHAVRDDSRTPLEFPDGVGIVECCAQGWEVCEPAQR